MKVGPRTGSAPGAGRSRAARVGNRVWESGATVPDIDKAARLAQVYGVTVDGLLKTETTDGVGIIPPAPQGKNIWGSVTIGERGQIVIPKAARDKFCLKGGDRLIIVSDETGIALVPAEYFENRMRELMEMITEKL